jgi:ABC-2 type transport system ATP-binding protein
MIELIDVHKRYGRGRPRAGDAEALHGIRVAFEAGRVTAVVGPNGAGKTTLFGIAMGFLSPTSGDVLIAGRDPRDWLREHGAGWLPERFTPPPVWRIFETLVALARMDGLGAEAAARAARELDRFGLARHRDRSVGTLSRGQLQRLGLVQALIAQHDLIVLDEPTGGLDPEGRSAFRDAVAELRQRNATVVLASHDIAEVERIADTVVLLEAGHIRDIVPARSAADYTRFRLRVNAPEPALRAAFPDASPVPDGGAIEGSSDPALRAGEPNDGTRGSARPDSLLSIVVRDVSDLNQRIATLIAAGGIVYEIVPQADPLEARIARTFRADPVDDAGGPAAGSS